jgi:hypothetical protein
LATPFGSKSPNGQLDHAAESNWNGDPDRRYRCDQNSSSDLGLEVIDVVDRDAQYSLEPPRLGSAPLMVHVQRVGDQLPPYAEGFATLR